MEDEIRPQVYSVKHRIRGDPPRHFLDVINTYPHVQDAAKLLDVLTSLAVSSIGPNASLQDVV